MLERIHKLIKHDTVPPQSVIELLKNTLIGTEGTLYQLLDTEVKIHALHKPHFIYLERNGKAIGNITICERPVQLGSEIQDSLYIRYFAFDTIFQGGGQKGNANSGFHNYFKALFETSNLNPVAPINDKSIYWAFIDPQNLRSFSMNERFGFQTIGHFRTTAFSRVHPKKGNVERLKSSDRETVLKNIQEFYKDFHFFSDVHLFENDNYFVLRSEGEIVCGIQANPVHWKIKSLPGFSGKVLLKTAPYLPRIRKLINPKNHRFLATEGLFWKAGYENAVRELLEGVLALTAHHSLLIWTDDQNSMLDSIPIKWGFIQNMKADNTVNIVAKFNGFSDNEISDITSSKKYLSGFDMT